MEKDKTEKEGSEGWRRGPFVTLNTETRKGLTEQVMAEQRLRAMRVLWISGGRAFQAEGPAIAESFSDRDA